VVKSGPGFSSVTIVSSGSLGFNSAGGGASADPNTDMISSLMNEMSRIMGGLMGGMQIDGSQASRPED
jgi:hypothetical protein